MRTAQRLPIDCAFHSPCLELNYYDQGPGEPVILIHGLGENATCWHPQVEVLAKDYRVIAPDLRGHGQSDYRDDELLTMKALADDIMALMTALNLDKAHFCGISMGGLVALEIFVRYAPKVKSLILADAAPFYAPPRMLAERLRLLDNMTLADWGRLVAAITLHRQAPPALQQEAAQMFAANRREPYRQAVIATFTSDYRWILPLINVPTLILVGEEDQITPIGYAMFLKMHIRGSVLRVIPRAAHLANLENPEDFNRHLLDHLQRSRRRAARQASGS